MPGTAMNSRRKGFFTRRMGPLQRQLRQGEYGLFRFSPMFESDFVQVSKQGGPIEIHNQEQIVTVGITSTSPVLLIPNVLLLARPVVPAEEHTPKLKVLLHHHSPEKYELTRLFPLCFVKITIHNAERQQLRFKLASGRTFYLQLCSGSDRREDLFDAWVRIVQLLRPPSEVNLDEQKKEKPKKLKGGGTTPALSPKGKSSSPKRAPPGKRSIHTATKNASTREDETKKTGDPAISSGSLASLHAKTPASSAEHTVASDSHPPSEAQDLAEKLEKESTHGGSTQKAGKKSGSRTRRKSDKKTRASRSSSAHKGTGQKQSKIVSLIRSCSWGYARKDKRSARAQAKGRKRRAE